jgi:hypothetical protein
MVADHAVKSGRRYRYYVAKSDGGSTFRVPASEIEPVVIRQVTGFLCSTGSLFDELGAGQLAPDRLQVVIAAAANLATELESGSGPVQRELLVELVEQVVVGTSSIEVHLKRHALAVRLCGDGLAAESCDDPIVVEAPVRIDARRRRPRKVHTPRLQPTQTTSAVASAGAAPNCSTR